MAKKKLELVDPLADFKIHPQKGRRFYVRVRIWRKEEEMYAAAKSEQSGDGEDDFFAMVSGVKRESFAKGRRPVVLPIVAEMYFCLDSLGPMTIAHESIHAAMHFLGRVGDVESIPVPTLRDGENYTGPIDEPEEKLAYAAGHIANEICRHALMAGISVGKIWVPK